MEVSAEVADKAVSTDDFMCEVTADGNQAAAGEYFEVARLEAVLTTLLENKFAAIKSLASKAKGKDSPKKNAVHKLQRILSSSTQSSSHRDGHSSAHYDSDQPCFGHKKHKEWKHHHHHQHKRKKYSDSETEFEVSPGGRHTRKRGRRHHHRISSRSPDPSRERHSPRSPRSHRSPRAHQWKCQQQRRNHHHHHHVHHHHLQEEHLQQEHLMAADGVCENLPYMECDEDSQLGYYNQRHLGEYSQVVHPFPIPQEMCTCSGPQHGAGHNSCCLAGRNAAQLKLHYDEDYISVNIDDFDTIDDEAIVPQDMISPQVRRKHRPRRKKRRRKRHHHITMIAASAEHIKAIDPDDLPQRARWTIVATACLLLVMCLLLVGVTLRMAPIIDEMVRKENEELMHSLNRDPLNYNNHAQNKSKLLTTISPETNQ